MSWTFPAESRLAQRAAGSKKGTRHSRLLLLKDMAQQMKNSENLTDLPQRNQRQNSFPQAKPAFR